MVESELSLLLLFVNLYPYTNRRRGVDYKGKEEVSRTIDIKELGVPTELVFSFPLFLHEWTGLDNVRLEKESPVPPTNPTDLKHLRNIRWVSRTGRTLSTSENGRQENDTHYTKKF